VNTYEQGRQEFETGRWSKAYRLFRLALKEEETEIRDRHGARVLMARCLAKLGQPDEAESELNLLKAQLPQGDQVLLEQFGVAWQELEDTRRLTKSELEARRKHAE
jgi:thioredoxin-like negative regulator of GroEL